MNYLIVYNNQVFQDSNAFHETVTKQLGIDDWWHYLPNVYIVSTSKSESSLANTIIERHPGLLFLIIGIDPKKYNGVLNKKAWEWIDKKGKVLLKLKAAPQPRPDPLLEILGLGTQIKSSSPSGDLLSEILGKR